MRYFILALLVTTASVAAQPSAVLKSPDGRLSMTFLTVISNQPAPAGGLAYTLSFQGQPILEQSSLQLGLKDVPSLGSDVRIVKATSSQTDETYHLVTGKTLTSYYTLQDDIVNAGGNWVDQEVCVDDNLITSRGPQDLPAFTGKLIEILARVPARPGAADR